MSLANQSRKARQINSTICLLRGCGHKHITACRSVSQPELNYQQVIKPVACSDGITTYRITCQKVQATGMQDCKGNGHTHTLCQHAISGLWTAVKALGKRISLCATFASAKRLLNLYKRAGGKLVRLVGESGVCWGVCRNA